MTAPLAPPPTRIFWIIHAVLACFALALPFARRPDWLGHLAFGVIAICAIVLWTLLLWGIGRQVLEHFRSRRDN